MTPKILCEMFPEWMGPKLAQSGHKITLDDLDDLYQINALCRRVQHPDNPGDYNLLRRPYTVPGSDLKLYPVSIARSEWMRENAERLFPDSEVLQYVAIAFALSVENSEDLYALSDGEIVKEVKALVRKLDQSPCDLVDAMRRVMSFEDGSSAGGDALDVAFTYGPVIATLCRNYGADPHYWLHKATIEECECMLDDLRRSEEQEIAMEIAKAGGKENGSPSWRAAMQDLQSKTVELMAKWEAQDRGE